ncbi:hypothetical protein Vadar_031238 [Vaccinium darrowii]|uniref:Uncharacterized protein n=1 Tax=Vaccinium darrowii TaxID=229202 RepID=A0ACB7XL86_9ERIC|nr:hypothetical protein Vadar_031238 [Vaccinium darrowii]
MGQGRCSGGGPMRKASRKPPLNGVFFPTHHSNEEEITPLFSDDFRQSSVYSSASKSTAVSTKSFPSFLLAFFLVFHLLFLHSSGSSCPSSFDCGPLGPMKFPFTSLTDPQCGLCTLSCHEQAPKVFLGDEGRSIQVSSIDDNAIKISDPFLKDLIDNKSCGFFSYINSPYTPYISYTISPNLTFVKCLPSNPEHKNQTDLKYFSGNCTRYRGEGCHGNIIYFSYRNNTVPPLGSFPRNCASFQLPIVSSVEDRNLSDPFSLLTANFSIEYHVSKECQTCLANYSQCLRDNREFHCLNEKRGTDEIGGRIRLGLILGTVIPGVILLLCFILIIRYRKKWRNYFSSYTIWSNTSGHLSKGGLDEGSSYFGIPVFSYSELKEATHNFDPSKELGDGGFGTVYHGKLRDRREVAVKRLYQHNYKRVAQFLNEIEILTHLRHPNLVTLYGCTSRHSRELLPVYEYIPNGTVSDHLHELISSLPAVDISRHRLEINLANLAISRIQDGAFNELIDPSLGFNSDSSVERMTTSVAEVAFRCLQLEKEMRPRMNEVLEALEGIQDYKDDEIEEMPPPSPDGDKVELLNSSKVPPSQDSSTIEWFSSSTASISSV